MSRPPSLGLRGVVEIVVIIAAIVVLGVLALQEPVTPSEEDCAARWSPSSSTTKTGCWEIAP